MQIIGFNFDKIEAERKKQKSGRIDVGVHIDIKNITSEKIEMFEGKNALKFDFEFIIDYKPDIAEVKLKGSVLSTVEKKEQKDILEKWKDKKLLEDVKPILYNFILRKCNVKSLQLEEDLNLPTHISFPRVPVGDSTNANYVR